MKFKKMAKIFLSCVLAGALFTGCGGSQSPKAPEGDTIKLGMITHLNVTEQKLDETYNAFIEKAGLHLKKYKLTFFDSLSTMEAGAESGTVDQISTYNCVAKYITATNNKFEILQDLQAAGLTDSFCFATRKDDAQLKSELDKAITEMKSDGTLDKLVDEYITNVKPDNIPKVDIQKIDGAQTIKVGITGDVPPLDLILPDNSATGFNTAILAEIGKRLNRNIELVQIDSGARSAALSSGQIDVVFWAIVPVSENIPKDIDKPEGLEFSEPYFKDNVAHIKLKSTK